MSFAQRRETSAGAQAYYELFPDIEGRGYATKVVPRASSGTGKRAAAAEIVAVLKAAQVLQPGMSVMHLRCDAGSLLTAIGEAGSGATLHGLDYFPTNVEARATAVWSISLYSVPLACGFRLVGNTTSSSPTTSSRTPSRPTMISKKSETI